MGKVLVFDGERSVRFDEYEDRPLKADEIRLKTLYSGISAGTQLTAYRGTNPMVGKKRNNELRLFENRDDDSSLYSVIGGWAYEEIGEVSEIDGAGRWKQTLTSFGACFFNFPPFLW